MSYSYQKDGVLVDSEAELSEEDVSTAASRATANGCNKVVASIDNDGYLCFGYYRHSPPFERIRRITGYLVGTIDRWNDAKKAEEHDRVKHGI